MNILFLPYEVESYALGRLSKLYKDSGNNTFILNADYWTFVNNKNFYRIYKGSCDTHSNIENDYIKLNTELSFDIVRTVDYLKNFEIEYSVSLNKLIRSDPILNESNHNRDIYHTPKYSIKLRWIELIIKKCLRVVESFKPDVILTTDNNYFIKGLFFCISKKINVPFLNTMCGRINAKMIVVDNFGIGTSDFFINKMSLYNYADIQKSKKLIKNIVDRNNAPYKSHNELVGADNKNMSFKGVLSFVHQIISEIRFNIVSNSFYRGVFRTNYFGVSFIRVIKYHFRNIILRKSILYKFVKFEKKLYKGIEFYYYPLHLVPESSVMTLSEVHREEYIIEEISAKLPINTFLVVKEHPSMVAQGERPVSFYKNLNRLDNVIQIDSSYKSSLLIEQALGVISLSGTALLEAVMHKTRAISVGNPEFNTLTEKYDKKETNFSSENVTFSSNVYAYVQAILDYGVDIDTRLLYYPTRKEIKMKLYEDEVYKLKNLFDQRISVMKI